MFKKKMIFLYFYCPTKNRKKNHLKLKLVKNLYIYKLFNLYINELK